MTTILVCLLIAVVGQAVGSPPKGPPGPPPFLGHPDPGSAEECRSEVGLTSAERAPQKGGELTESELCFIKCLGTKSGSVSKDGTLNMENIKNHLPEHMEGESDTVLACLEKVGAVTSCQDIKKVAKCFPEPKDVQ